MPKHLITTNDLTDKDLEQIFEDAQNFLDGKIEKILQDKIIMATFFENSTRTRSSFEVASKRLGAEVVSLDVATSSTNKGETTEDTAKNLDMMGPDAIIVRHKTSGMPSELSKHVRCSLINGGDGSNAHPTQALLDLFTIKQYIPNPAGKTIAIVGDIKNSRVASSNINLLKRYGLNIILVAPTFFLPEDCNGVETATLLSDVIDRVDIVMSLRTQLERHEKRHFETLEEYGEIYCVTKDIIKDKDIILLHPGPVNRNIDISDELLEDKRCKVFEQVQNGVAIRMAVLKLLLT